MHRSTIQRLWARAKKAHADGLSMSPAVRSNKNQRGRHPIYDKDQIREHARLVPLQRRKSYRSLAANLGISHVTVFRYTRGPSGIFKKHTSAIKPALTDDNKLQRVMFALGHVGGNGRYEEMYDRVYVDEKWFYMTEASCSYILVDDEEPPHRVTRHKDHIEKVMFLCAVARPRWCAHREATWDGKIGMWPVAERRPALRNSVNRPAGTLEWKSINMDKNQYTKMMVRLVLPAIKAMWPPGELHKTIHIQHDNATPHIKTDHPEFLAKNAELGIHTTLYFQPPNSPDTNILDLCFFNSIQSLQHTYAPTNVDELVVIVLDAFVRLEHKILNHCFLTLQGCFNEIIDCDGGNGYKIPHMGKARLARMGLLPISLEVTTGSAVWDDASDEETMVE